MKLLLLILLLSITGCSSLDKARDASLTEGCAVIEADAKLGWFNQEGRAEVCKIKCSPNFSDDVVIEYDNPRSGCKVTRKITNGSGT